MQNEDGNIQDSEEVNIAYVEDVLKSKTTLAASKEKILMAISKNSPGLWPRALWENKMWSLGSSFSSPLPPTRGPGGPKVLGSMVFVDFVRAIRRRRAQSRARARKRAQAALTMTLQKIRPVVVVSSGSRLIRLLLRLLLL